MSKETLTLTEAIKEFSTGQSARKADRLHRLFKGGEYIIPVSIEGYPNANEAVAAFEQGAHLPFIIIQHPEIGNYIPVFTDQSLVNPANLPANTISVKINFQTLLNLLQRSGNQFSTIVFDPDYSGLMFRKDKFINYAKDLIESERQIEKKAKSLEPAGEIRETLNGLEALDKNTLRTLKREFRKDSRIASIWLVKNTYENDANVWDLRVELETPNEELAKKVEKQIRSRLPKRDHLNCEVVSESLQLEPLYTR